MTRTTTLIAAGALFFAAAAPAAGKAYDDREVMKQAADLAGSAVRAIPGPRQCDSQSGAFAKDPVKGQMEELGEIERALSAAGRRDDDAEIRQLRAAVAGKTAAFVKAVAAYGASAVSYASVEGQIKEHQKTKPNC